MNEIAERLYDEGVAEQRAHVERKRGDLAKAEALLASMAANKPLWLNFYNMPRPLHSHREKKT